MTLKKFTSNAAKKCIVVEYILGSDGAKKDAVQAVCVCLCVCVCHIINKAPLSLPLYLPGYHVASMKHSDALSGRMLTLCLAHDTCCTRTKVLAFVYIVV